MANDCNLSIIEPYSPPGEYLTPEERELMEQFPKDHPEPPEYDEVLTLDLIGARGTEIPKHTAENILYFQAEKHTPVGEVFKTARFWCLRVKYID